MPTGWKTVQVREELYQALVRKALADERTPTNELEVILRQELEVPA